MMDPELGDALVKRKSSRRLNNDDDSSSSDENAGDTDVRDIASSDAAPVVNDDHNAGIPVDPVYAVNNDYDNSIASANSEDEMMFDEEMEDFAEQMEFTGDIGPGTLPSSSGTPGVIFDRSARNQAGDDTVPQNDTSDDDLARYRN